jgi:hypothetical protein
MRVIECHICGELVSAANDDELGGELRRHYQSVHPDAVPTDDRYAELVGQAYDAMDS